MILSSDSDLSIRIEFSYQVRFILKELDKSEVNKNLIKIRLVRVSRLLNNTIVKADQNSLIKDFIKIGRILLRDLLCIGMIKTKCLILKKSKQNMKK